MTKEDGRKNNKGRPHRAWQKKNLSLSPDVANKADEVFGTSRGLSALVDRLLRQEWGMPERKEK